MSSLANSRPRRMAWHTIALLAIAALVIAACGTDEAPAPEPGEAPPEAPEPAPEEPAEDEEPAAFDIDIDIFSMTSPMAAAVYLADEAGYFEEEGLSVTVTVFASGGEASQAFRPREADLLIAGDMPGQRFASAGDEKIIAAVSHGPQSIWMVGLTDIESPEDLRGRRLGTNMGSTTELWLARMLDEYDLHDDLEVLTLDPGSQVPALINGDVDATISFVQIGVRATGEDEFHQIAGWESTATFIASDDMLTNHPDALVAMLRAIDRAGQEWEADFDGTLERVSGIHGLTDEAFIEHREAAQLSLGVDYTPEIHVFHEFVSDFLVDVGDLDAPFDWCSDADLSFLIEAIGPERTSGAPDC